MDDLTVPACQASEVGDAGARSGAHGSRNLGVRVPKVVREGTRDGARGR